MASNRNLLIDALRGLAIVLMLVQHMPSYLVAGVRTTSWYTVIFWMTRLSAPLFFMIAGYCLHLSWERRGPQRKRSEFLRHLFFRSAGLFLLGILVNLFRFAPPFGFNVLHCISLSLLIAGGIRLTDNKRIYVLLLSLTILYTVFEPLVRPKTIITTLTDVPYWLFTTGVFPVMSWNVYFLIGLGLGWYGTGGHAKRTYRYIAVGLMAATAFLVLAKQSVIMSAPPRLFIVSISALRFFRGHNNFIFLGTILSLLSFVYVIFDHLSRRSGKTVLNVLATYGRHSLFVYVFHQFLFQWLPNLVQKKNSLEASMVFLLLVLFLILLQYGLRTYERAGGRPRPQVNA